MAALAAAIRGAAPAAGSPQVSQQLADLMMAAARANAGPSGGTAQVGRHAQHRAGPSTRGTDWL